MMEICTWIQNMRSRSRLQTSPAVFVRGVCLGCVVQRDLSLLAPFFIGGCLLLILLMYSIDREEYLHGATQRYYGCKDQEIVGGWRLVGYAVCRDPGRVMSRDEYFMHELIDISMAQQRLLLCGLFFFMVPVYFWLWGIDQRG